MDSYRNVLSTVLVLAGPMLLAHLLRAYTAADVLLREL
jgi:hypothetical protein